MGVVSSKRRLHVISELRSKGLDVLFDVIVAQEDNKQHKTSPVPLTLAANRLGVHPADCGNRRSRHAQHRCTAGRWEL